MDISEAVDHPSQAPHSHAAIKPFPDRLYVVTVISNPARYASRYRLYRQFEKMVEDAGAILITVELAFGGREFEVTSAANPRNVQLRSSEEIWHKENLLNIGVSRLPASAQYIATIDADLTFARTDWAQETIQQLQHAPIVQMFSEISNLAPNGERIGSGLSFVEGWRRGLTLRTEQGEAHGEIFFHPRQVASGAISDSPRAFGGEYPTGDQCAMAGRRGGNLELGAPGGAWAYRRSALDALGGLIDFSLVGAADYFMAAALFGVMPLVLTPGYHPEFREKLLAWQDRAERNIRRNVGLVPGHILHGWHGKPINRGYGTRWRLLVDHAFNPSTDLKRDTQGVYQLHDDGSERFMRLRDDLRSYFASRNEDSIDV